MPIAFQAAHLAQLQSKIRRLTAGLEALGSDVRLAESEEKHAMDIVDDKDEPTAEDRVRVTAASADLEALQVGRDCLLACLLL